MMSDLDEALTPVSYTVRDFCRLTGLGKTTVYERIKTNEIRSIELFGRRLILASEVERLINSIQ